MGLFNWGKRPNPHDIVFLGPIPNKYRERYDYFQKIGRPASEVISPDEVFCPFCDYIYPKSEYIYKRNSTHCPKCKCELYYSIATIIGCDCDNAEFTKVSSETEDEARYKCNSCGSINFHKQLMCKEPPKNLITNNAFERDCGDWSPEFEETNGQRIPCVECKHVYIQFVSRDTNFDCRPSIKMNPDIAMCAHPYNMKVNPVTGNKEPTPILSNGLNKDLSCLISEKKDV